MRTEAVTFASGADHVAADLFIPDNAAKAPAIVMGNGFNGVKEALKEVAMLFCDAGYVVLAIDFRRFGSSGGEPRGLKKPFDEVDDFRNAVCFLETCPEADPDRIGLWGVSFACGVALYATASDRRIKCVVGQSPSLRHGRQSQKELRGTHRFEAMLEQLNEDRRLRCSTGKGKVGVAVGDPAVEPDYILVGEPAVTAHNQSLAETYPTWRREMPLETLEYIMQWSPMDAVEHVSPTPMLLVANGGADHHHVIDKVQEAFRRAGEPKRLVTLPYDITGLYTSPGREEAAQHAIDWFDTYLKAPGRAQVSG